MAENSLIAWTTHTWNPWVGCVRVSPGCQHCYAETLVKNRMGKPQLWGPKQTATRQVKKDWSEPRRWAKKATQAGERHRVFCGSLMDFFEDHPIADATRPRVWEEIRNTPELDWLLLTKRPENIPDRLPSGWPFANVWLGTSIEDIKRCDRAQELVKTPAAVHFISAEPLLEDISEDLNLSDIEWLIIGGESGPGWRPMKHEWARNLIAKCRQHNVAPFFKQSAAPRTEMGIEIGGFIIREYPTPKRVAA
jgi:protein gp37